MREAFECLHRARVCDMLARHARDRLSTRLLRDLADQWRQLAHDTARHKRQTGRWTGDDAREIARNQHP